MLRHPAGVHRILGSKPRRGASILISFPFPLCLSFRLLDGLITPFGVSEEEKEQGKRPYALLLARDWTGRAFFPGALSTLTNTQALRFGGNPDPRPPEAGLSRARSFGEISGIRPHRRSPNYLGRSLGAPLLVSLHSPSYPHLPSEHIRCLFTVILSVLTVFCICFHSRTICGPPSTTSSISCEFILNGFTKSISLYPLSPLYLSLLWSFCLIYVFLLVIHSVYVMSPFPSF